MKQSSFYYNNGFIGFGINYKIFGRNKVKLLISDGLLYGEIKKDISSTGNYNMTYYYIQVTITITYSITW